MGDSVRVSANQRLDKPDFDAIQSLVYRGMREAFGGILGGLVGALSGRRAGGARRRRPCSRR